MRTMKVQCLLPSAAVMAFILLVGSAQLAAASPLAGGDVAGTISFSWNNARETNPDSRRANLRMEGSATLSLRPGAGAAAETERLLVASGNLIRPIARLRPYLIGADIASAEAVRAWDTICTESETHLARPLHVEYRVAGISSAPVALEFNVEWVDLLTGRGSLNVNPFTDNPGYRPGSSTYPFPSAGFYYMPLPGALVVDELTNTEGCLKRESEGRQIVPALSTIGDGALPFDLMGDLNERRFALRRINGRWLANAGQTVRSTNYEQSRELDLRVQANLRMATPISSWRARCQLPRPAQLRTVRTSRAAVAMLRRAGFPNARYGGVKRVPGMPLGRFWIDPSTSSSGGLPCFTRQRVPVYYTGAPG